MDIEIKNKIEALEKKIDAIYVSAEKTRKYILWTAIVTIALIVLPMIGLAFALPAYVSQIQNEINFMQ